VLGHQRTETQSDNRECGLLYKPFLFWKKTE